MSKESLFGDEPSALFGDSENSAAASPGLFNDTPTGKSQGGLFGDDSDPWLPSTKPKRRSIDVGSLLQGVTLPEAYVDLYGSYESGGGLSLARLGDLLEDASIVASDKERIVNLVLGKGGVDGAVSVVDRERANVAFALIALAQKNEEISLDAVDDMRHQLPIPKVHRAPETLGSNSGSEQESVTDHMTAKDDTRSLDRVKASYNDDVPVKRAQTQNHAPEEDPWVTGQSISSSVHAGLTEDAQHPERETHEPSISRSERPNNSEEQSYGREEIERQRAEIYRALTDPDAITVQALPDKEGMPLWKHINYRVASRKRKSEVIRRYSDFAWLIETLLKRYPFRQVPLLPPKRLAGMNYPLLRLSLSSHANSGQVNVMKADASFLERRRKGLTRFINALERHPILRTDPIVTIFLTNPTEISVWRKTADLAIQEEFFDKYLAPELENTLPSNLETTMGEVRDAVKNAIESFTVLVQIQERTIRRQEASAADLLRIGLSLGSYAEQEQNAYYTTGGGPETKSSTGPAIVRVLKIVSNHHTQQQVLAEDEARAYENGFLEDLKRYRDTLTAMYELFLRHDKYAPDNISSLSKRILNSNNKLKTLEVKPDAKQADKDKLSKSIKEDESEVTRLQARRIFIKECVWRELEYFEQQGQFIGKLFNEFVSERVKFSELGQSNWLALNESLEHIIS